MNTKETCGVVCEIVLTSKELQEFRFGVGDFCYWTKGNKETKFIFVVVFVSGKGIEHLGSTHRVSYIGHLLLTCLLNNIINHSFVILSHVLPGEVKELLLILIWVVFPIS